MNAAYALPMKLNKKWVSGEGIHGLLFSILGCRWWCQPLSRCLPCRSCGRHIRWSSGGTLAAHGALRRQVGECPWCFFWSGPYLDWVWLLLSRCASETSARGGRTHPRLSLSISNLIMTRPRPGLIILGVVMIILGRGPVWTSGGKAQRSWPCNRQAPPYGHGVFLVGIFAGFCFGHSLARCSIWGLAIWGEAFSVPRSKHGASPCHDVERCVWVALSLRPGSLPGRNLLLHLDAQEEKIMSPSFRLPGTWYYWFCSSKAWDFYGIWQHHSLQYLDRQTRCSWALRSDGRCFSSFYRGC